MSKKIINAEYVNTCAFEFGISPKCIGNIKKWDKKTWQNDYDLTIRLYWSDDSITYFNIPKGTATDGSSVPFPLNAFIPSIGPNIFAALPHDIIYRNPGIDITCGQADDIYYFLALQKKTLAHDALRVVNFLFKTNPNYRPRIKYRGESKCTIIS